MKHHFNTTLGGHLNTKICTHPHTPTHTHKNPTQKWKICGTIHNLRYADETTLMVESEEELKSLLKVKVESEKVGLKLNIQKMKIMASGITS